MTDLGGERVLQYPTHAELIEASRLPAPSARAGLDAIIVPATRPAENLRTAVKLAKETDARLIVLCSFRTHADEVRGLMAEHRLRDPAVVEMPRNARTGSSSDFKTTQWVHGPGKGVCGARNSDLSMKRNTGLLLARTLGWERIFFIDDDIRAVSAETVLNRTVSGGRPAATATGRRECRSRGTPTIPWYVMRGGKSVNSRMSSSADRRSQWTAGRRSISSRTSITKIGCSSTVMLRRRGWRQADR